MIDEKKLIEDLLNNYLVKNDGTWNDAMDRAVELTKTAPKVGEWIPVSKRLPEPEREVLLQFENNMVVGFYFFKNGNLDGTTKWYGLEDDDSYTFCDAQPIAWMPLPEPYRKDVE